MGICKKNETYPKSVVSVRNSPFSRVVSYCISNNIYLLGHWKFYVFVSW